MWIYAAIGGGVVGGVISALSYMSSLAVSGEQFDFGKFIGTTTVGVLNGILGGVAGVSSGFLKITLILASGGVSGIYTYRTTKGTHEYKLAAAVAAGTITTIGTYTGTLFDTNRLAKIDIASPIYINKSALRPIYCIVYISAIIPAVTHKTAERTGKLYME